VSAAAASPSPWTIGCGPTKRIGSDVDAQIARWGALSISLREMQGELAHSYMGVLGQRTLLQRLHQLQNLTPGADERPTPPIRQWDAIWFTQLCATGQWRSDGKGRRRPVKSRRKRCLLIALGVWPDSDRQEVLAWRLADGEDPESWLTFLSQLEEQGLRDENGLELIIHDGGSGLCAALHTIHFDATEQRCLFHKLRNIWQAIRVADDLPQHERIRQRRTIYRDFVAIFQAKQRSTVLRRALKVVQQYRKTQPAAVATLRRDFRATVAYCLLQEQHPTWHRSYLRTTSRLERFNRRLRRRIRSANAYHSDAGVLAMIAQVVDRTFSLPSQHKQHAIFQPNFSCRARHGATAHEKRGRLGPRLPIREIVRFVVPVTFELATELDPRTLTYHGLWSLPDNEKQTRRTNCVLE
jgi:hypothetical protein